MANQVGYEALAVSTTSIGFTAATVTRLARAALITIEGAHVRYRGDPTAPTGTSGMPLLAGKTYALYGEGTIIQARFILLGQGVGATVHGAFYDQVDLGAVDGGQLAPATLELLASAVRTATTNTTDQVNFGYRGVLLIYNVTAVVGTPTLQCTVECKDPSGTSDYIQLFAATANITATGEYIFQLYPAATAVADASPSEAANRILPRTWRVTDVIAGTTSLTYSLGASYLV